MRSGGQEAGGTGSAWLGLTLVRGLLPARALALSEALGGPDRVLDASAARLASLGIGSELAAEIGRAAEHLPGEMRAIAQAGAALIAWDAPGYPALLRQIPEPPLALVVRGTLAVEEPAVAVVGARRASEYGRRVAAELAGGLALAGIAVVSGLATGIDGAAHRGALERGGRTLAVLGTGVDRVYPPWHRDLADAVAAEGALISEFPMGSAPLAYHFPRRNRIISGLSLGTVVVEAAEQSGSLITARCALEQGREVFAVPGPVGPPQHRACHRLIQQGAKLVTTVEDVLEEIAPQLVARVVAARAAVAEAALGPLERQVLAALGAETAYVDQIIRGAGMAAGKALETLLALELVGLVEQVAGKRFRRRAA